MGREFDIRRKQFSNPAWAKPPGHRLLHLQKRIWNKVRAVSVLSVFVFGPNLSAETDRVVVDFSYVEEKAQSLAKKAFDPPPPIPEELLNLDYDEYRSIRFNPIRALWSQEELPFRIELFHLGYLYKEPVVINETTATHKQEIPYSSELYNYGEKDDLAKTLPSDLGYAGIRILYPLNDPGVYDEVAVFQGSSYFRMLSRGQVWGLSARGLAINTGIDESESFPLFREFWLRKPEEKDRELLIYALLDGKWATGAYEFKLIPGDPSRMKIRATLFFRQIPSRIGLAPFSSMFWYGENTLDRPDDFRPEVHDSDYLVAESITGEYIARPLENTGKVSESFFQFDGVKAWGLLQRDRVFENYQDIQAAYHLRPGGWVEPTNGFGSGSVYLLEIPVETETVDNIAAMWLPNTPPEKQSPYSFSYDLTSPTMNPSPNGWVQATHQGRSDNGRRLIAVDWGGERLAELSSSENVEVALQTSPENLVEEFTLEKNPYNKSWRMVLYLSEPSQDAPDGSLRAFLRLNDQILTETWTLPWKP